MLGRIITYIRKRLTPMDPEEYREAHFRILLSSAGGVPMACKDGKIQVERLRTRRGKAMKQGFYIDRKGVATLVHDHEQDLRANHRLLRPLGVSERRVRKAVEASGGDREELITAVLKQGVIRFRGHGHYATAEFWGRERRVVKALAEFGDRLLCPDSTIRMVDIESMTGRWTTVAKLKKEACRKRGSRGHVKNRSKTRPGRDGKRRS